MLPSKSENFVIIFSVIAILLGTDPHCFSILESNTFEAGAASQNQWWLFTCFLAFLFPPCIQVLILSHC